MRHSTVGARRKYSDDLIRQVRAWKPRREMCAELGIKGATFDYLRRVQHKKPSP